MLNLEQMAGCQMVLAQQVSALAAEADRAQALVGDYRKLLAVVASIKAGDVNPQAVTVDLVNLTWSIEAPVEMPTDEPTDPEDTELD